MWIIRNDFSEVFESFNECRKSKINKSAILQMFRLIFIFIVLSNSLKGTRTYALLLVPNTIGRDQM